MNMDNCNGCIPEPMKPQPYKCWLSEWFMATRADAHEYHCTKLNPAYTTQCDFCAAKEIDGRTDFAFVIHVDSREDILGDS